MSGEFEIKVEGLALLKQRLLDVPKKIRLKMLRLALREGAKIVLAAARAAVPVRTGQLRQNLVIRALSQKFNDARVGVGIKAARKIYANSAANRRRRRAGKPYYAEGPSWYGRLLEFGAKPHLITVDPKTVLANATKGGKRLSRQTFRKIGRLANHRGLLTDGATIFGRTVQHPGTRARPFLKPALEQHVPEVLSAFQRKLTEGLNQEYPDHG